MGAPKRVTLQRVRPASYSVDKRYEKLTLEAPRLGPSPTSTNTDNTAKSGSRSRRDGTHVLRGNPKRIRSRNAPRMDATGGSFLPPRMACGGPQSLLVRFLLLVGMGRH